MVFPERGRVAVEDFDVPAVGPHHVLIRSEVSLISAGTELTTLLGERGTERYPSYPGYSNVGVVEDVGAGVTACRPGERVLTLGRHASHVVIDLSPDRSDAPPYVQHVPAGIGSEDASFAILDRRAFGSGVVHLRYQVQSSIA